MTESLPLEGIRVLDLSRLLPGPFCSLLLADFGADVVKVEDTALGDYIRWAEPKVAGAEPTAASAMFLALNRNKRSIRVDLKTEAGRDVLLRLVRDADVLLESFRPGVLDRLGVGYERLREVNPGLVYCAISGYGQDGPYRDRSGHDLNYLGLVGLLGLSGDRGGPPGQAAGQIADLGGGALMAAFGILAALRERDRSGEGQLVDVSMADGSLSWLAMVAASYFASGRAPRRGDLELGGRLVCYRPYACADGWVTLGALEPKFWAAWCRGVGREDLVEKQFEAPGSPTQLESDLVAGPRPGPGRRRQAVAHPRYPVALARRHGPLQDAVLELDAEIIASGARTGGARARSGRRPRAAGQRDRAGPAADARGAPADRRHPGRRPGRLGVAGAQRARRGAGPAALRSRRRARRAAPSGACAAMTDTPLNEAEGRMTHREVLEALSGLMLGMLVAILSSTVVATSLPVIISDLGGGQSSFTWVITSTLLAMTVTTPIWGKLSDLLDRKLLVQLALVIFTVGSMLAGLSQSPSWLIGCRVLQGVGAGGLMALVQVILSDLVSARERGRYMGYLGAVMAVGTVGGPLIGGLLTDTVGWRWNFLVGAPIALAAIVTLQRTLHLPPRAKRKVHIDVPGAVVLSAGISLLLIWVSLAGQQYAWGSWQTAVMVPGSLALIVLAIWIEDRAPEPLVPLRLFTDRTVVLSVLASVAVGVAMFGTSVFLSQYLQIARDKSPTVSGLLTLPMVLGVMVSSTVVGQLVARTGRYKRFLVTGSVLLTVGMVLMGTIDETTPLAALGIFMALLGLGVGMMMQNLVLIVQNSVAVTVTGAATALVAFFRSLAGAAGVAVLGAVLASHTASGITEGLAEQGLDAQGAETGGALPQIDQLPPAVGDVVQHAYGAGVADIFLVAAPAGLIAFVAVVLLREQGLTQKTGIELAREQGITDADDDEDVPPPIDPPRPLELHEHR